MLLTSFSKHSVLIPRGQSVSAVTGGIEYFREDRQHTCTISSPIGFGQRYHVDRHGQLTLKQLRLSVLNEMHTNSYSGPRLIGSLSISFLSIRQFKSFNVSSGQVCSIENSLE